jgi:hypothetical protein
LKRKVLCCNCARLCGVVVVKGSGEDDQGAWEVLEKCVSIRRGELRKISRWHEGDRRTWGDGVLECWGDDARRLRWNGVGGDVGIGFGM